MPAMHWHGWCHMEIGAGGLKRRVVGSDVPAQLGLKAAAKAQLRAAQGLSKLKPK